MEPVFDDHEDSDYDDLASSRSSDVYSPRFEPSLPALGSHVVTPELVEPDMLSLSGDTVSNAETVSDQLERDDSIESFDLIRHEDIPDELREMPVDAEEVDQGIMMSDHTIVPPTPTISHRLSGVDSTFSPAAMHDYGLEQEKDIRWIVDYSKAHESYSMPDRPLRLLMVASKGMTEGDQLTVIAKIMSAVTAKDITTHVITEASDFADESVMQPFHQKYEVLLSEAKSVTVCVDHVVAYSHEEARATLKNEKVLNLSSGSSPDLVVFFHVPAPSMGVSPFPQNDQGISLARALSKRDIAMLEMCRERGQYFPSVMSSITPGNTGLPFLHVHQQVQGRHSMTEPTPFPIPLALFEELDNTDLSRHLACLSGQHKRKSRWPLSETISVVKRNLADSSFESWLKTLCSVLSVVMLVAATAHVKGNRPDAASHQAFLQNELSLALKLTGIDSVNASSIIHFPTKTMVSSGTTSVGLTYPTAAEVHVAKSDQLFVALANRLPAKIYLSRNGKSIADVNVTKIVEGVYEMSLQPSDAYGQVQVDVNTPRVSTANETIKVDLGNRLLHGSTYKKAARDVQNGIQRDVEEAHTTAKAVQARFVNGTRSALKVSFYRAKALREGLYKSSTTVAHQFSLGLHGVTNSTLSMMVSANHALTRGQAMQVTHRVASFTKNATVAVGSALGNTIPAKRDLARARSNSLKLKEKLFGHEGIPVQNVTIPIPAFGRLKKLSLDARQGSQRLFTDVVYANFCKLFQGAKPSKGGSSESVKALVKRDEPRSVSRGSDSGLTCQKKCSKKMNGDVQCHKCKRKSKVVSPKKAKAAEEGS